jgi:hypothetical protein
MWGKRWGGKEGRAARQQFEKERALAALKIGHTRPDAALRFKEETFSWK